jgi:hypothetical protein
MNDTTCQLRATFHTIDPAQAQQIRDAYYKAVEGLQSLAELLERADCQRPEGSSELLIGEHLIACEALAAMNRSELGRVL